jgi:hypothetical protein
MDTASLRQITLSPRCRPRRTRYPALVRYRLSPIEQLQDDRRDNRKHQQPGHSPPWMHLHPPQRPRPVSLLRSGIRCQAEQPADRSGNANKCDLSAAYTPRLPIVLWIALLWNVLDVPRRRSVLAMWRKTQRLHIPNRATQLPVSTALSYGLSKPDLGALPASSSLPIAVST